jgi:hypothetical protein
MTPRVASCVPKRVEGSSLGSIQFIFEVGGLRKAVLLEDRWKCLFLIFAFISVEVMYPAKRILRLFILFIAFTNTLINQVLCEVAVQYISPYRLKSHAMCFSNLKSFLIGVAMARPSHTVNSNTSYNLLAVRPALASHWWSS